MPAPPLLLTPSPLICSEVSQTVQRILDDVLMAGVGPQCGQHQILCGPQDAHMIPTPPYISCKGQGAERRRDTIERMSPKLLRGDAQQVMLLLFGFLVSYAMKEVKQKRV